MKSLAKDPTLLWACRGTRGPLQVVVLAVMVLLSHCVWMQPGDWKGTPRYLRPTDASLVYLADSAVDSDSVRKVDLTPMSRAELHCGATSVAIHASHLDWTKWSFRDEKGSAFLSVKVENIGDFGLVLDLAGARLYLLEKDVSFAEIADCVGGGYVPLCSVWLNSQLGSPALLMYSGSAPESSEDVAVRQGEATFLFNNEPTVVTKLAPLVLSVRGEARRVELKFETTRPRRAVALIPIEDMESREEYVLKINFVEH